MNFSTLFIGALLFLPGLGLSEANPAKFPAGYIVQPSTISPNRQYGVGAFDNAYDASNSDEADNRVVDLRNGRVVGEIDAWVAMLRMNDGGILPARWTSDSSFLLWEVEGKWCPWALVLLKIKDDRIEWQLDLLKTAQQAILVRTRKAAPKKYAAAKKWFGGSGEAYPDGFTVNVRAEGDKERGAPGEVVKGEPFTLPLKVHAELTSNPKEMDCPPDEQLDSELDGEVNQQGEFTVLRFHLRDHPFSNAMSTSWLKLTDPAAAAKAPPEYGDDVSLRGNVLIRSGGAGKSAYILILKKKLSIPASTDDTREDNISEVQLLGMDVWPDSKSIADGSTWDIMGMLGHVRASSHFPAVTLKVTDWQSEEP